MLLAKLLFILKNHNSCTHPWVLSLICYIRISKFILSENKRQKHFPLFTSKICQILVEKSHLRGAAKPGYLDACFFRDSKNELLFQVALSGS